MQMAWAELLPHKVVWYDILDCLELLSLYDSNMREKHQQVLQITDILTYSARRLQVYTEGRADALYLPNAVSIEDFESKPDAAPADIAKLVATGLPIIGYFGAIEEWFNVDLLLRIAKRRPNWQFILIGRDGMEGKLRKAKNIHLLGMKRYEDIRKYGHYFHTAIIPFIVNDWTNGVSPVKFFEYAALGLPVVSTSIEEMKKYRSEWVFLANSTDKFEAAIEVSLKPATRQMAQREGNRFARKHRWSNRVDAVEQLIYNKPTAWKSFSNYDSSKQVAFMTATFLDYEGEKFFSGGAERYLLDLVQLCEKLGKRAAIYQYGNYPWIRKLKGVDVISLSRGGQNAWDYSIGSVRMFNRLFQEQTAERAVLSVYSAYFNAWPHGNSQYSIGIIHGVCWDNPASKYSEGVRFWEHNRRFIESTYLSSELVSVDTNSANWFQTIDYELGQKIKVVPNYVDNEQFKPRINYDYSGDAIVILYPRRLYAPRGLYVVLEVLDRVLEKYPQVEFHFVGKGDSEDTVHVERKIEQWNGRVKWYWLPLEEMAEAYRRADISLIPSLYSEGTSLSCLEAMACGNAVIATRIGGLSDLVIHNYNGLLIEPDAPSLLTAIEELVDDSNKLTTFKQRSVEVANVFSKRHWETSWTHILQSNVKTNGTGIESSFRKGRLVEFYLSTFPHSNSIAGRVIIDFLNQGDLIYLRINGFQHSRSFSFGRLQWMNWEEAGDSTPDLIIADAEAQASMKTTVIQATLNQEGELEWISSYPQSPNEQAQP
jgi:glycosyltransferase involved in cell wall biosynthesis